jgi:hypothetical protein
MLTKDAGKVDWGEKGDQMTSSESRVLSFLAEYPLAVQAIALELRLMILSTMPGVQETLDRSARIIGYGFGTGYGDMVCTIIPSKNGVKLGIVQGAELADESGLLQGSGKRHRYVPLKEPSELKKPGFKLLLVEALTAYKARTK